MADGFQSLIQLLQNKYPAAAGKPGIMGLGSPEWGSKTPGYREQIRASIKHNLPGMDHLGTEDLTRPPKNPHTSISISHSGPFGGWLSSPLPRRIGFDIEVIARLRPELIKRMSTPEEIESCPDPAFLWCAKEAFFKALAQDQPQSITRLLISDWERMNDDVYSFKASPHKPGHGWIVRSGELLFGACFV